MEKAKQKFQPKHPQPDFGHPQSTIRAGKNSEISNVSKYHIEKYRIYRKFGIPNLSYRTENFGMVSFRYRMWYKKNCRTEFRYTKNNFGIPKLPYRLSVYRK